MSRTCDLLGTGRLVGNNVSKSNRKTKRTFLPNLIEKSFRSDALRKDFSLKITTRTYRTIVKHGSLDAFLSNVKKTNLTELAKNLRNAIFKVKPEIVKQKIELASQRKAKAIAISSKSEQTA